MIGDFNINWLDNNNFYTLQLKQIVQLNGFKQLINDYTRVTLNTKTIIDLMLSNNFNFQSNIKVLSSPKITDHNIICLNDIKYNSIETNKKVFKKLNFDICESKLIECDWNYNLSDVNGIYNTFEKNISECISKSSTTKFVNVNGGLKKNSPWFDNVLQDLINLRDCAYRKFKLTGTENDWENYKRKRNDVTSALKTKKQEYYNKKIDECKNNSQVMWKTLKTLINSNQQSELVQIKSNNVIFRDPQVIANTFNTYFIESIKDVRDSIPPNDSTHVFQYLPSNFECQLNKFQVVTINELRKIVFSQKCKASSDDININFVKQFFHIIGHPLLNVINCSLETGIFPDKLKLSVIKPIQKVVNTVNIDEFRPINLLPVCDKLLEIIVHKQIMSYIRDNNILIKQQSGFRENHSCESAINFVLNEWKCKLDNNETICAVFLDLKRAFETLDRDILISKLRRFGFKDVVLNWFSSYLSNRVQIVKIGNKKSEMLHNDLGVPKGSVLGPLLFILYINDISNTLGKCEIHLFADDALIYNSGYDNINIVKEMNIELQKIEKWMNVNKLKLNHTKCKTMFLTNEKNSSNIVNCDDCKVQIANNNLDVVESMKYLGVVIDRKLKFNLYVDYICKKVAKKLNFLRRLSQYVSSWTLKLIYNTIIMPHFTFCSTILYLCTQGDLGKLQVLQNRAMRIILKCSRYTRIKDMLDTLGWLNIQQLCEYNSIVFIFKIVKGMLPGYLKEKIKFVEEIHSYRTRQTKLFYVTSKNKKSSFNNIFHKGLNLYNTLPDNVKSLETLRQFKINLKQYYNIIV